MPSGTLSNTFTVIGPLERRSLSSRYLLGALLSIKAAPKMRPCGCYIITGCRKISMLEARIETGHRCVIDIWKRGLLCANYRLNGENISRFTVDKISLISLARTTLLVLIRARRVSSIYLPKLVSIWRLRS